MRFAILTSVFLLGVVGATTASSTENGDSPCAIISKRSSLSASGIPTVPAKTAYDCLNSVPLNPQAATDLVNAILPYIEWQSDIAYLKDPPTSYKMPAIDLWQSFNDILQGIKNGEFANEYEFQVKLFSTFNLAHDGHFRFAPDLMSKIQFRRRVQLVSVSRDGVELPRIYVKGKFHIQSLPLQSNDIASLLKNATTSVSPITKINSEDAVQYLENLSQLGFLQDPDALYNTMFYELAMDAQYDKLRYSGYFAGSGRGGMIYAGTETSIEFSNGTERTYENYAEIYGNWKGVVDGPSAYDKFCTGPKAYDPADDEDFVIGRDTGYAHGYPVPKGISSDKQISGYFLDDDPAFADVAVLSILSFEPYFPAEFQSVIEKFISDARAAGKTKVVIDLSGNGGGIILNGYDAFRQFFPSIVQDGFSRFREHDAFNIMSKQISNFTAGMSLETASTSQIVASQSVLDYRFDLNQTNQNFLTYDDKFSPHTFQGDEFTSLLRWNLTDPLLTTSTQWGLGMSISGYGSRQNFEQPFAAEDIVMVYDGYCASTCSIFSEMMRTQGGVKSIAMGGRPNRSPIQAIGGTKGSNNYPFSYILSLANIALQSASQEERMAWKSVTELSNLPMNRSTDSSINVRDMILRDNLEDGTPAQFLYEEADCRLFYTPDMIRDPKAIWKAAARAAWGDENCVAGSLHHKNETLASRRRRSEDLKTRARAEKREFPVFEPSSSVPKGARRPVFGKKVPL
ncbi:hypothetical protein HYFRA_00003528 [Hymenoscyphus fraxineus]|uniref:Tail specific protease domain-containing protein n=1 Tax=Hymenoscyphus fraxineus TaxID=746836 RepID=A0A9N9KSF8_9HELO|nr:hypothetical protein HYFRA_00003528 [Hymenoscyphus fraxineus]